MSDDRPLLDSTLDLPTKSADELDGPRRADRHGNRPSLDPTLVENLDVALNPVDELAEDFSRRLRSGETPSIEEYVEQLPDQAVLIRSMFQSIAMVERIGKQERAERKFDRKTTQLEESRKTLGDFRIVREIGRGGMGIVYEAIQQSLNRRVALKVASVDATQSVRQLQRFRREAEAAAKLHHTNIVPIYGTGEDDGLSYYAMQLIDGIPLSDVIQQLARRKKPVDKTCADGEKPTAEYRGGERVEAATGELADGARTDQKPESSDVSSAFSNSSDSFSMPASLTLILNQVSEGTPRRVFRPRASNNETQRLTDHAAQTAGTWFRTAARMTAAVAHALHYAHQHKVLHRDIKPANLMIDADGTIWITDFGLARQEEHGSLTNTGDIVGTLRYMAPEQFNGLVDVRSDVCSLGLTFWEMLTLRPAYEEQHHAALIKSKSEQSLPSPRTVNPSIPKDLDTIANKASALDPKHRYQSAGELADDLERFLADRPIQARRATRPERRHASSKV